MIFPENSPIPLCHLVKGFSFPLIRLLISDLVLVFSSEFLSRLQNSVAQIASFLKSIILLAPFEEQSVSIALQISFGFLLFN